MSKIWVTEGEAASRLGMSKKWLQKQRISGGSIPFAKFGGSVRYKISDLEEFERNATRLSTSESIVCNDVK